MRRFPNTAQDRKVGPPGYVYSLTGPGLRITGRTTVADTRQRKAWRPHSRTLDHWLAISELYVRLMSDARSGGPTVQQFQVEADARRTYRDDYGRLQILRPDALVRLAASDLLLSFFVEIDRDTESPRRIAEKCRTYRAYELTDIEYEQHGVFPGVLFIVPDKKRAQAIGRVIAAQPEDARDLYRVTTQDDVLNVMHKPEFWKF